jgi:hypothetical protein
MKSKNENEFVIVWSGRTEYFDEIIDTFASAGIKREVDEKNWVIKVERSRYNEAYGMLMDLNTVLEAGW